MKRLLIIVDYQKDFVDGSLGFPEAAALDPAICAKIKEYETSGDIVYTMDTHGRSYLETEEGRHLPVPHCIKNTAGWELYGQTARLLEGKRFFEKDTFGSSALFEYLQENPYQQIELAGVVSSICILSNAVLAKTACPDAELLVDSHCVAAPDPESNLRALDSMRTLHITVL